MHDFKTREDEDRCVCVGYRLPSVRRPHMLDYELPRSDQVVERGPGEVVVRITDEHEGATGETARNEGQREVRHNCPRVPTWIPGRTRVHRKEVVDLGREPDETKERPEPQVVPLGQAFSELSIAELPFPECSKQHIQHAVGQRHSVTGESSPNKCPHRPVCCPEKLRACLGVRPFSDSSQCDRAILTTSTTNGVSHVPHTPQ
mmetsp:Transcript_25433/g.71322  ORF Transcript_25433/g.71322 Transcript_25433/m.71322 type:complete len:203 (-) Transcript_25433:130-738(-)